MSVIGGVVLTAGHFFFVFNTKSQYFSGLDYVLSGLA